MQNNRIINAWCMYDWANSVYSLVITTAIFPIYYNAVTTSSSGSDIVSFFGLEIELWKVDDSLPAPKFNIISKPNDWSKSVSNPKIVRTPRNIINNVLCF